MVSDKEIKAAREAWRKYWCEEDVPRNTRDGMTAALEAAARVRAEANAESKPEQVPSGWKLVPEEPTEEMYRAVYKVQDDCAIHNYGASPTFDDYWSAALSASPAAPTAGGGE